MQEDSLKNESCEYVILVKVDGVWKPARGDQRATIHCRKKLESTGRVIRANEENALLIREKFIKENFTAIIMEFKEFVAYAQRIYNQW